MSGYKWDPVFRVVPVNGAETVYWLADRLTDCGGHNRIRLRYVESQNIREDLNRSLRPVVFGLRPEVEIECQIFSMADQAFLSEIESALLQPRDYAVYLSLDGGVVERQVVLSSVSNPEPLAGKTIVGAVFRLGLRCVDLIATKPAMMTDPGTGAELLSNGAFDEWSSSSVAPGWAANSEVTLAQESTVKVSGSYSAKITKSGVTGNYGAFTNSALITLNPAAWYRIRASAQGGQTNTYPSGLAIQFWNTSYPGSTGALPYALFKRAPAAGESIGRGSSQWVVGAVVQQDVSASGFTSIDVFFRGPTTPFKSNDVYQFRMHGIQTQNEFIYYDDVSLYGPVLRTGYATW